MNEQATDERLRWALRGLRQNRQPEHDLWPGIAARIAAESTRPARGAHPRRHWAPLALAASLLLAVGVVWQTLPPPPATQADANPVRREAHAMTREYDAALREIQLSSPQPEAARMASLPELHELDRSAAQIRTALRRDPGARFLLDRLRHTYTLRLTLTQRAVLG